MTITENTQEKNWRKVVRSGRGGTRGAADPNARIYGNGVVVMSTALYELLGSPSGITPYVDDDSRSLKLAVDDNGFTVNGAPGQEGRITMKSEVAENDWMVGRWIPVETEEGAVVLARQAKVAKPAKKKSKKKKAKPTAKPTEQSTEQPTEPPTEVAE